MGPDRLQVRPQQQWEMLDWCMWHIPKMLSSRMQEQLPQQACPASYTYAYDDPTNIFTCSTTGYLITFINSVTISKN
ncbi:Thaumatin-like protein, partial [Bienertia sinuspersici]